MSQGRHELDGYEIEREIGRGSFATVYLARDLKLDRVVAVKAIDVSRLNRKLAENLATEVSVMKEFRSEHIVELFDLQKAGNYVYLVMEYCERGDLAGLLRKERILAEERVRVLVKELAEALKLLFAANYAHRDLKPQNILLDAGGSLKLGDFGFARFVDPMDMAETLCGSPLYMAPEILRYEPYDGRADLWSVGAIMYEMLYGRPPYRAQNHIQLLKIIERAPGIPFPPTVSLSPSDPEHPVNVSDACKDLIRGLLQRDPERRLNFDQFITHPFFDDRDYRPLDNIAQSVPAAELQKGFSIPRPRTRSASSLGQVSRTVGDRRSSLSSSLRHAQTASITKSSSHASSISTYDDPLLTEESRLSALINLVAGMKDVRPALIKLLQRDGRLGLILKDRVDSTINVAEGKAAILGLQCLAIAAAELFQNCLQAAKDSAQPFFNPTDEHARALVLWLGGKAKNLFHILAVLQKRLEDLSPVSGLSITSASISSAATDSPSSVSETIYNLALKYAVDGGLKEVLGQAMHAEQLYKRSLFLLETLASPTRPTVFLDLNEPRPSQQDLRVIQGCTFRSICFNFPLMYIDVNVIQQRLNSMARSPTTIQ